MTEMKENKPNDLLLLAGKIITFFMQAMMMIGGLALLVGIPLLLFYRTDIVAKYAAEVGDPTVVFPVFSAVGVMLIGIVLLAMLFLFFGKLRQIINTVGEGDPFQPANADRLSIMAWLALGAQLLFIPALALGTHLASYADEMEDVNLSIHGGWDIEGILLVIILFILARVFRHGAEMREDLEGTV